jgi:phage terminase large subunit
LTTEQPTVWQAFKVLRIMYQPTEKQLEFHNSPAKYRFYGGAVGGGKSMAILFDAVAQCLTIPGAACLILRRTLPELEQSQISRFRALVPASLYDWNEQKKTARFKNGSMLRFGHLDIRGDELKFQGDEYLAIYFDELTHFEMRAFQYLTTRNRSTTGARPNMAGASNPGGRGHAWVKALWVDKKPAPGMEAHEYVPEDYAFISAKLGDNPFLLRKDPGYLKTLEKLPVGLRMALLDGSWSIHAGQYFDCFDRESHVTANLQLEDYFPRWVGLDWGFAHSCCAYWCAERADGKIVVYREAVVSKKAVNEIAEEIGLRSRGEHIETVYLSPDAFAKRSEERSIAERFGDAFRLYGIPQPIPAVNNRVLGWRYLHDLLSEDKLLIHPSCASLIEKIPQAIHDDRPGHEEDVLKQDGDDEIDAWRYAVMSRERTPVKPYVLRLAERVTATDPTSRAIQARVARLELGQENASFKPMGRNLRHAS